ncbi:MAG: TolC family protein [Planctomycetota bacterium]|jgi:outer membrane protein TolC
MFRKSRLTKLLCYTIYTAVALGLAGGCSSEHYKLEADKEVYKIIDSKWQDSFGQKANYTISDVPPSPNDVQIEKAVPESGIINLAHAVAMATAHNRDYQRQKEDLYLKALTLTLERHKYARQWFGTIDALYSRDVDAEVRMDIGADQGEKGFGFEQTQLLADGIEVGTSLAIHWLRFLTGDPRTSLGSVLIATLKVPVLGSGAGKVAQENLTQTERNVLYHIRTFNRERKRFVVSIINDYYRVLQRRDAVTNAENNYKRRLETKEQIEMEAQAGRRDIIQVGLAGQNLLEAQDGYVSAQESYQQALDQFKIRLSLPTDANVALDQNELKALEGIGVSELDYMPEAAVETALTQRLDLANTRDNIDDSARKLKLAADGLGPQLNLTGNIDVSSRGETDFSTLQFHRGIFGLLLDADLPFDRKNERNAYRRALITLKQQQRAYEEEIDNVKLQVRQAYRQLREAVESYRIQRNSLDLAETRRASTLMLLRAGRATARDLQESEDALFRAQNSVTQTLIDHAIAKLSFFRDIGILQVRPDGMWDEKISQAAISQPVSLDTSDEIREERIQ